MEDQATSDADDDGDNFADSRMDFDDTDVRVGPAGLNDPETGYATFDGAAMTIPMAQLEPDVGAGDVAMAVGRPPEIEKGKGARPKEVESSRQPRDPSPSPEQLRDQIEVLQRKLERTGHRKRPPGMTSDSIYEASLGRFVAGVDRDVDRRSREDVEASPPKMQRASAAHGGFWSVADQPRLPMPDPREVGGQFLARPLLNRMHADTTTDRVACRLGTVLDAAADTPAAPSARGVSASVLDGLGERIEKCITESIQRAVAAISPPPAVGPTTSVPVAAAPAPTLNNHRPSTTSTPFSAVPAASRPESTSFAAPTGQPPTMITLMTTSSPADPPSDQASPPLLAASARQNRPALASTADRQSLAPLLVSLLHRLDR